MRLWGSGLLLLLCSCATAAFDTGENESPTPPDATVSTGFPDANTSLPDAAPLPDAKPEVNGPPDAGVSSTPDAGGLFCDDSSECGAGACCLLLTTPGLCVLGSEPLPGVCLPD